MSKTRRGDEMRSLWHCLKTSGKIDPFCTQTCHMVVEWHFSGVESNVYHLRKATTEPPKVRKDRLTLRCIAWSTRDPSASPWRRRARGGSWLSCEARSGCLGRAHSEDNLSGCGTRCSLSGQRTLGLRFWRHLGRQGVLNTPWSQWARSMGERFHLVLRLNSITKL